MFDQAYFKKLDDDRVMKYGQIATCYRRGLINHDEMTARMDAVEKAHAAIREAKDALIATVERFLDAK